MTPKSGEFRHPAMEGERVDLGLSIAASALGATEQGVAIYANDLANANTTAFAQTTPLFAGLPATTGPIASGVPPTAGASPAISLGSGVEMVAADSTDSGQSLVKTGIGSDAALVGPGYFVLRTAAGPAYTRDGSFGVDAQGNLVSQSGALVLSSQGVPISVGKVTSAAVRITRSGAVMAGSTNVGQLGIATFPNPSGLVPVGQNAFSAGSDSGPATLGGIPAGTTLIPGALASSGTDVAASLTGLITLERSFQLDTKILGQASQMLNWAASMG